MNKIFEHSPIALLPLLISWNIVIQDKTTIFLILSSTAYIWIALVLLSRIRQTSLLFQVIIQLTLNSNLVELIQQTQYTHIQIVYTMWLTISYCNLATLCPSGLIIVFAVNLIQMIAQIIVSSFQSHDKNDTLTHIFCIIVIVSMVASLKGQSDQIQIKTNPPEANGFANGPPETIERKPLDHTPMFKATRKEGGENIEEFQLIDQETNGTELVPYQTKQILNMIEIGVVLFNAASDIIFANRQARKIFKCHNNVELKTILVQRKEKLSLFHKVQESMQFSLKNELSVNDSQAGEGNNRKLRKMLKKRQTLQFSMKEKSNSALKSINFICQEADDNFPYAQFNQALSPSIMLEQVTPIIEDNLTLNMDVRSLTLVDKISQRQQCKVLIVQDKTKNFKSEEKNLIHQFNHLLLNSFSHELRTPLNCSFQLLEALSLEIQDPQLQQNYIQPIICTSHLLMHQINDILDYAAFESDDFQPSDQQFELVSLVKKVVTLFEFGCKVKQIHLSSESSSGLEPIYIKNDPKRISQVLVNLLNNSTKFTNVGGSIRVTILRIANNVKISVADTGIGIEQSRLQEIRRLLYQRKDELTEKIYVGLGLKVANLIVQRLNSDYEGQNTLEIKSKQNQGCKVSFTVSASLVSIESIKSSDNLNLSGDSRVFQIQHQIENLRQTNRMASKSKFNKCQRHPSILIVDDVAFNVMAVKMLLHQHKLASDECYNGLDALNLVKGRHKDDFCQELQCRFYKVILMDIEMPIMNGITASIQILKYLKSVDPSNPTKIIICSAYDSSENISTTMETGVYGFLPKPIEKERLFQLLSEVL